MTLSTGFVKIKLLAVAVLLSGIVISFFASYQIYKEQQEKDKLRFSTLTKQVTMLVSNKIESYVQIPFSGAALFRASDRVDADEWLGFVKSLRLEKDFSGLGGLGYARFQKNIAHNIGGGVKLLPK